MSFLVLIFSSRVLFFISETVEQFKNGLPAIRSNALLTHKTCAAKGITTSIGANFLTSLCLKRHFKYYCIFEITNVKNI